MTDTDLLDAFVLLCGQGSIRLLTLSAELACLLHSIYYPLPTRFSLCFKSHHLMRPEYVTLLPWL